MLAAEKHPKPAWLTNSSSLKMMTQFAERDKVYKMSDTYSSLTQYCIVMAAIPTRVMDTHNRGWRCTISNFAIGFKVHKLIT